MAARRCANTTCRGPLTDPWSGEAAPNRRYCSAACRQEAYRRRHTGPAVRRQTKAATTAAAADVDKLVDVLTNQLQRLRAARSWAPSSARLAYRVSEVAANVELLAAAAIAYDRAAGVPWAELADDTGLAESTLRRRAARAATAPDEDPTSS